MKDRFHANPDLPVYISGDRDTLHGDMVKVYETVRAAGIQKVAFMTDSKKSIENRPRMNTDETQIGRAGSPLPAEASDAIKRRARSDAPYRGTHPCPSVFIGG